MTTVTEKIKFIQGLTTNEIEYINLYLYDIPDIDLLISMVKQYRREERLKYLLEK